MTSYTEFMKTITGLVLLDGGLGSMLIDRGLEQGTPPDVWNLEKQEQVQEVHDLYYKAGSHIVHTNTFGSNRIRLKEFNLDSRLEEINRNAVKLIRHVCPDGRLVAGDMGPTGKFLKPFGPCEFKDWRQSFSEQAAILADAGVDFISIETMYDFEEAMAALQGAKETGLSVWVSMTFRKTPRGYFTLMGNSLADCITRLKKEQVDSIGINCTLTSAEMIDLVKIIEKDDLPSMHIQPNAGTPKIKDERAVYDQPPEEFAQDISKIIKLGINRVGGCCGTTPEFITEISPIIY